MLINWDNIGISGESSFLQLFYDPLSETMVAHFFRSIGNGYGLKSLWAKPVSDGRYARLTRSEDSLSYEDPVLCPSSPHIFANVMRVGKAKERFDGYEWHSLQRIDLRTGRADVITQADGAAVDASLERMWISTLHGSSADGSVLYCTAAFQKRGQGAVSPTEYYLSRFVIGESGLERITKLEATYL